MSIKTSTSTTYTCDRCGRVRVDKPLWAERKSVSLRITETYTTGGGRQLDPKDLCDTCTVSLMNWLANAPVLVS